MQLRGPSAVGGGVLLQRIQERNQLILLRCGQVAIIVDDVHRFVAVTQDRVVASKLRTIVQQAVVRADAP